LSQPFSSNSLSLSACLSFDSIASINSVPLQKLVQPNHSTTTVLQQQQQQRQLASKSYMTIGGTAVTSTKSSSSGNVGSSNNSNSTNTAVSASVNVDVNNNNNAGLKSEERK
jgi:hypothetical protein